MQTIGFAGRIELPEVGISRMGRMDVLKYIETARLNEWKSFDQARGLVRRQMAAIVHDQIEAAAKPGEYRVDRASVALIRLNVLDAIALRPGRGGGGDVDTDNHGAGKRLASQRIDPPSNPPNSRMSAASPSETKACSYASV
jgi:hypothetical protein